MATRVDVGIGFSRVDSTPSGGVRVPGYPTRTGVFLYKQGDGSVIRELRHPDEVFDSESLSSLRGAPLTIGHPSRVTADNWRQVVVGHVGDHVRAEKKFVAADLYVQDGDTSSKVLAGELVEMSCGYSCDVVEKKGTYDGEEYDCVQTNIRYNHVALGPKGFGRAGAEARLYLDAADAVGVTHEDLAIALVADGPPKVEESPSYTPPMAAETEVVSVDDTQVKLDSLEKERADALAKADALAGELAAAETEIESLKAALSPEKLDAVVEARLELLDAARKVCGSADFKGKTDREVMVAAVTASDPAFNADGLSDDFVRGVFAFVTKNASAAAANPALAKLNADAASATAVVSRLEDAQKKSQAAAVEAWKKPLSVSR